MAFSATMSTAPGIERPFSLGPIKAQTFTFTAASGDTSGTITIPGLSQVSLVVLGGSLVYSAAHTYSTNIATVTFTDPAATVFGTGIAYGR